MRAALTTVIAWILLPVTAIVGLTRIWPEGAVPTLVLLALAIVPGSALAMRRARQPGKGGAGLVLVLLTSAALAVGATVFLFRYLQFYRLHSLVSGPLLVFVALPALLTITAAVGALCEAQARRRGIREAGAAGLAIGSVALTLAALMAVVLVSSASDRRARNQGNGALGPFFAQIFSDAER